MAVHSDLVAVDNPDLAAARARMAHQLPMDTINQEEEYFQLLALLLLDDELGVAEEGDFVLLNPRTLKAIMAFRVREPQVHTLLWSNASVEDLNAANARAHAAPFEVELRWNPDYFPDADMYDWLIPEALRGRIIRVRFGSPPGAESAVTCRADGTVIRTP